MYFLSRIDTYKKKSFLFSLSDDKVTFFPEVSINAISYHTLKIRAHRMCEQAVGQIFACFGTLVRFYYSGSEQSSYWI